MELSITTIILGALCMAGSTGYVLARSKNNDAAAAAAKAVASTSFIAIAIANGALLTAYGRLILIGLVLSWFGDVLLLSLKRTFLLAGLLAFLFAHFGFAAAFAAKPLDLFSGVATSGFVVVAGAVLLRWLWKYLDKFYKIAVPMYLAAIGVMIVLAVAASAVSLPMSVAVGAVAFAISDVSVARDRFVERSISNKVWGIPLYYFAQVLLAASVSAG